MANLDLAFVQLFWDLMNRKTGELGKVEFHPQKPSYDLYAPLSQAFPRSTPEEEGVSSAYIARFVHKLRTSEHVALHELMILRHGHVIFECGFNPYMQGIWHVTYSMCKSFTGMAVGLLIDEGRLSLEDHVAELLSDELSPLSLLSRVRYSGLKVRHLLTMSSGASFNEVGAISGNDWVKGFFESQAKFPPGDHFEYNSMNSFILSAIVTHITGETMFEYLSGKLFAPMGIRKVFWEVSPTGITKAGWGMFITQEDAAKLGQLYLQGGVWNGRQLISKEWVQASVSPQIKTGREDNPEYGYHIWMNDVPGSFMYNGMLGQNVYIYPDKDMVVVVNAGNDEVFAGGTMTRIIREFLPESYRPQEEPLSPDPAAYSLLMNEKRISEHSGPEFPRILHGGWGRGGRVRRSDLSFLQALDGRRYEMHSKGIGLAPLIMQVVHNNYTNGIRYLTFSVQKGVLYLLFQEGNDLHRIPVGFGRGRHTAVNLNGEEYLVGTIGRFGRNEDGLAVLTLRIAFIEEATERKLKIVFTDPEHIRLYWSETPGDSIISDTLEMITTGSGNVNPFVGNLLTKVSPLLLRDATQRSIEPVEDAVLVPDDRTGNAGSERKEKTQ